MLLLCPKIVLYICEQSYFQKKILIEKFSTTESIKYPVLVTGHQVAHFFSFFLLRLIFFHFFGNLSFFSVFSKFEQTNKITVRLSEDLEAF